MLIDTFNPYKPSILAWPNLSRETERWLIGLYIAAWALAG
jgi:hypothetical protein